MTETKSYLLKKHSGEVSVMHLVRQPDGSWPTVEECMAKWTADKAAEIASTRPLDIAEIPSNRTFRNAWRDYGDKLDVDMPAARDIWRDTLRKLREPRLAALDIAYQRADERGDSSLKAEIAAEKQALRDVTDDPAIEAAQTPEELMTVIPTVLQGAK